MKYFADMSNILLGLFCFGYMVFADISGVNRVIILGIGSILINLGREDD